MSSQNSINNATVNASLTIGNTAAASTSSDLDFLKSRSGSTITTGDTLGTITFQGYDGTQYTTASQIVSVSSGTIASTRIGSDLEFYTHPDSTTSSTQRMVIQSGGTVVVNSPDTGMVPLDILNANAINGLNIYNSYNGYSGTTVQLLKSRSGSAITSGDALGSVAYMGYDGTNYIEAASIRSISTGTIATNRVATDIEFWTHPDSTGSIANRMTIASTGAVTIAAPDSGVGLTISGGGLSFGGSTLSTFTDWTSWTPTVDGAVSGTTTYTIQYGRYSRIGNIVTAYFTVNISAATGTGDLIIGGLPIAARSDSYSTQFGSLAMSSVITWPTGTTSIALQAILGQTNMKILASGSGVADGHVQLTNNSAIIQGSITYGV